MGAEEMPDGGRCHGSVCGGHYCPRALCYRVLLKMVPEMEAAKGLLGGEG